MLSVLRPPFSVLQTVSISSTSEEAGERAETGERRAESLKSSFLMQPVTSHQCFPSSVLRFPSSKPFPLIRLPKKLLGCAICASTSNGFAFPLIRLPKKLLGALRTKPLFEGWTFPLIRLPKKLLGLLTHLKRSEIQSVSINSTSEEVVGFIIPPQLTP